MVSVTWGAGDPNVVPTVPSTTMKRLSNQQGALDVTSPYPRILEALKPIFMRLLHPSRTERVTNDNLEPPVGSLGWPSFSQKTPTAQTRRMLMRDPSAGTPWG